MQTITYVPVWTTSSVALLLLGPGRWHPQPREEGVRRLGRWLPEEGRVLPG